MEFKKDNIVENFHGTKVSDPYRWLEDPNSEDTVAFGDYQEKLIKEYFKDVPKVKDYKESLTRIWNHSSYFVPKRVKDSIFYLKKEGLENQEKLYVKKDGNKERILIDPNTFSDDGTVALTNYSFSEDGKLIAYTTSVNGSDRQEIKVRDIESGKDLGDLIKWCKFTNMAWTKDNFGFYYSRFPEPGTVDKEDENNYSSVYYHKIGEDQSKDELIYNDRENKELGYHPTLSEDGKYLILHVGRGTSTKNRVYYKDINSDRGFVKLLSDEDAQYRYIGNDDSVFYFKTDYKAPKGRIIAIDTKSPNRDNWKEIIKETEDTISSVSLIDNQFVVVYMHHAYNKIKIYDINGTFKNDVILPFIGTVTEVNGSDSEMYFGVTSFLNPTIVYNYDLRSDKLTEIFKSDIDFDSLKYEINQVFYPSKDSTKIPMFLIHKKDIVLDSNNPVLLFGYGGFNISLTPSFNPAILSWLESGGVYAVANLRGGGEYGDKWHSDGMLHNKQNVFDDFISGAEWLIENKYTNTKKLSIMGRSNGGLLVSACMVQRPDLYGGVICNVPVTDMLRYHKFTVGRYWVPEYGDVKDPEEFKTMYEYSPLHNVDENATYPPILVATGDTDDRVVPSHAKKLTATLQERAMGKSTVLLRVEKKAGHGAGKPTSKLIDEWADFFGFLAKELDF